jgi:hypothetical protein
MGPPFVGPGVAPLGDLVCASQATSVACSFSNSTGGRQPKGLWRRCRLWKISRYSKIALASSRRVHRRPGSEGGQLLVGPGGQDGGRVGLLVRVDAKHDQEQWMSPFCSSDGEPWPTVRLADGTLRPLFSEATTRRRRVECPR